MIIDLSVFKGFVLASESLKEMSSDERKLLICQHYAKAFKSNRALSPIGYKEKNWAEEQWGKITKIVRIIKLMMIMHVFYFSYYSLFVLFCSWRLLCGICRTWCPLNMQEISL